MKPYLQLRSHIFYGLVKGTFELPLAKSSLHLMLIDRRRFKFSDSLVLVFAIYKDRIRFAFVSLSHASQICEMHVDRLCPEYPLNCLSDCVLKATLDVENSAMAVSNPLLD